MALRFSQTRNPPKGPQDQSATKTSSGPVKQTQALDKAFRDATRSAIEHNGRLSEVNKALQGTGATSSVAASEVTSLARGLKLNAAASQTAAVASEQSALGANLQAEAVKLLLSLAWQATKAVFAMGVSFSKTALEAVDFREGTIAAIDAISKKKGEGSKAFEIGVELAARFHLDPRETIASLHGLISKGFTADRARVVLTAMADLKVLSPKANLDKVSLAIEQIQGKGKLQMEELQGQLAEAGLSVSKVLDELAAKYGKSTDEVRKMISKGKVSAEDGIDAIVAAIQKMGTGKLGDAAERAARGTVSGLVAGIQMRLGAVPLEMARTLASSAGVGAVKGALGNLLDALNPGKSPEMKGMVAALSVFASTLFSVLFGGAASQDAGRSISRMLVIITNGIRMVTSIVQSVGPIVMAFAGGFAEGMLDVVGIVSEVGAALGEAFGGEAMTAADIARSLGRGLAYLVGVVALVVGALATLTAGGTALVGSFVSPAVTAFAAFIAQMGLVQAASVALWNDLRGGAGSVGDFFDSALARGKAAFGGLVSWAATLSDTLQSAGMAMGTNLWSGFVNGILAGVSAVTSAGTQLASAAENAVKSTLDIHSPSRVMDASGQNTSDGFVQGIQRGQGQVDAAMNTLVTPPTPPGSPAAGGAAGTSAGVVITIGDIHVHAPGSSSADADAIGRSVRRELEAYFEDALAQAGLSPVPG